MKIKLSSQDRRAAHWLVVDDNAGFLEFMATTLESFAGAEVARFSSAIGALPVLTAAPEQFEFIVTDLEMPGMDGIEFCRRARALSPNVKVLLVTGQPIITHSEARHLGFCGLLHKPFSAAALGKIVAALETSSRPMNNFSQNSAAALAA